MTILPNLVNITHDHLTCAPKPSKYWVFDHDHDVDYDDHYDRSQNSRSLPSMLPSRYDVCLVVSPLCSTTAPTLTS